MSRPKIVIASILKPVDDTRAYEKLGLSLSQTNKYDINIIGFWSKKTSVAKNVTFLPLPQFTRLSVKRLYMPAVVLIKCLKLKPSILIITTHELLWTALICRLVTRCRIIYDIQENYYYNISYTSAFSRWLRGPLAHYVRLKEIVTHPFIAHYFLAEKGYANEVNFIGSRYSILENKYSGYSGPPRQKNDLSLASKIKLIFTGTLSEETGILEAIDLVKKLHRIDPNIRLEIYGRCMKNEVLKTLENEVQCHPFITLRGGANLVPHDEIIEAIKKADFGLVTYRKNPSFYSTIPTKIYEYLALQLPILLTDFEPWVEVTAPYQASVNFDLLDLKPEEIYADMCHQTFYKKIPQTEVLWASQEHKLLHTIDSIIT